MKLRSGRVKSAVGKRVNCEELVDPKTSTLPCTLHIIIFFYFGQSKFIVSMKEAGVPVCVRCNAELQGKFCSACGEKVLNDKERTIGHFFGEFFHVLTHADSKFLKSLKYIFTRPGFLTNEFIRGRRKLYTAPLAMFVIGNLLYFLFSPVDALNTPYASQVQYQKYSAAVRPIAEQRVNQSQLTREQFISKYDANSAKISKVILILLVFLFSVPVSLLFYSSTRYYVDHLTFATEFINVVIYGIFLFLPLLLKLYFLISWKVFGIKGDIDYNTPIAQWTPLLLAFGYLAIAAKRVYKQSLLFTIPKAMILSLSLILVLFAYRFILFCVALAMT